MHRTRTSELLRRTRRHGLSAESRSVARAAVLRSTLRARFSAVQLVRTFWMGLRPNAATTTNGNEERSTFGWSISRIQSPARSTPSFPLSTKTSSPRTKATVLPLIPLDGSMPASLPTGLKNLITVSSSVSKISARRFAPYGTRSAHAASRLRAIANCAQLSISSLRSLRKASKYLTKFSELPTGRATPASTLACYLHDSTTILCAIPAGTASFLRSMIFIFM